MEAHETKARKSDINSEADEEHSCPCGGTVKVCDICNGDYHEDELESKNCYLGK